MLARLVLLFLLVPVLELVLLVRLGQLVGLWPTLALVLATAFAGAALARLEGMRVLFQFRRELASGRLPGQALLDGISVLVGGVLLLAPGILTDFAGLALLFPPTRRWIQRRVRRRLERSLLDGSIRVVTMRPPGFGGAWPRGRSAGGFERGWPGGPGSVEEGEAAAPAGLDPSKGIVIEPDER